MLISAHLATILHNGEVASVSFYGAGGAESQFPATAGSPPIRGMTTINISDCGRHEEVFLLIATTSALKTCIKHIYIGT